MASPLREPLDWKRRDYSTALPGHRYTRSKMEISALILFLAMALIGSYVQSVTGFAMGLLMIAVMIASGLVEVPFMAAVISLLTLTNILLSLRGHVHQIARTLFVWLAISVVPGVAAGVFLLTVLERREMALLEGLLGLFIVGGSVAMLVRPRPRRVLSSPLATACAGMAGGVLSGLFSASGPVMGGFMYRQPLALAGIRATLLAYFALSTSVRLALVGMSGGLTPLVLQYALAGLPMVLVGTWLGRRFAPLWSEATLKRGAFALLLATGAWMLLRAVRELWA